MQNECESAEVCSKKSEPQRKRRPDRFTAFLQSASALQVISFGSCTFHKGLSLSWRNLSYSNTDKPFHILFLNSISQVHFQKVTVNFLLDENKQSKVTVDFLTSKNMFHSSS
jgi:hypothetical protein